MDSVSFFWSFFKMLAALAIVIALMIIAMYFIKKYFFHSLPEMNGSTMINIISTRHLSPKNSHHAGRSSRTVDIAGCFQSADVDALYDHRSRRHGKN